MYQWYLLCLCLLFYLSHIPSVAVKRGRGRPRRYPRPDESLSTNQIPAMIIPSSDGQTIMMAPLQVLVEGLMPNGFYLLLCLKF